MAMRWQRRSAARPVAGILLASAAGAAVAVLVGAKLAFPVRVTSNSMAPYVSAGDYGVAAYAQDIRRGDVIAFRFPFGAPELAIKRAVALPGECAPPVAGGSGLGGRDTACDPVPLGSVFVLGDNIGASIDSRSFGPVPSREIVGKVVLVVPVTRWLARWRTAMGS
jgi:type IV secretory pathway protease TraF